MNILVGKIVDLLTSNKMESYGFIIILIFLIASIIFAVFKLSDNIIREDYYKPLNSSFLSLYKLLTILYVFLFPAGTFYVFIRKSFDVVALKFGIYITYLMSISMAFLFYLENKRLKNKIYNETFGNCIAEFSNERQKRLRIYACILLFTFYTLLNINYIVPNLCVIFIDIVLSLLNYKYSNELTTIKNLSIEILLIGQTIFAVCLQIYVLVYSLTILRRYSPITAIFISNCKQSSLKGLVIDEDRNFYIIKDSKTHKVILLRKDEIKEIKIVRKIIT